MNNIQQAPYFNFSDKNPEKIEFVGHLMQRDGSCIYYFEMLIGDKIKTYAFKESPEGY